MKEFEVTQALPKVFAAIEADCPGIVTATITCDITIITCDSTVVTCDET